ncbi:MAG: hypothetical protein CHACPFDD_01538 [Phycisphaerae bacterium]|nr:hypothetical protein [Phycisphaerae bacterium]
MNDACVRPPASRRSCDSARRPAESILCLADRRDEPRSAARCRNLAIFARAGAALVVALWGLTPAQAQGELTEKAVDDAIARAVRWIRSERHEIGWEQEKVQPAGKNFWGGDTALAVLALLYAGEDPRSDEMASALKFLCEQKLTSVYAYSLRAHTLALVPGQTYRGRLTDDVQWLLQSVNPKGADAPPGSYDYWGRDAENFGKVFDNSNSQYAVLGIWMAADAGIQVPESYWSLVEDHWLSCQLSSGAWSYRREGNEGHATGSMTAAGLATLFVVLEKAHARDEGAFNGTMSPNCGKHKEAFETLAAIERGLDWFGREFAPQNPGGEARWQYYYLYGVERVGRASGRKYFRGRDWFRGAALDLLATQEKEGNWPPTGGEGMWVMTQLRNTCLATMVLCHGRAPLFFNKLQHGEDWNNKVRDLAGIARYAEKRFERLLNWQVVSLDASLDDLLEAPVLYMSGHEAWSFDDAQVQKLREYCDRGGFILGVACCSRPEFAEGFKDLAKRMYPELPLRDVQPDHPILSRELQTEIKEPPPLLEVHNGVRTLMLLSAKDICAPWNQNLSRSSRFEPAFDLACNIYLYATDKTSVKSRLATSEMPVKPTPVRRTVEVARIRHNGGNWNPEPYGWKRFGQYMQNETGTRLEINDGVALDSEEFKKVRVAHMTGSAPLQLSATEIAALRRFLTGGGTLLVDAASGSTAFAESVEKILTDQVKIELKTVQKDSVLVTGAALADATPLDPVGYRRAARREGTGRTYPRLKVHDNGQRITVIFSNLDLSASLLGTSIYDCRGYDADSALRIMRNMVLYAGLPTAEKVKLSRTPAGG